MRISPSRSLLWKIFCRMGSPLGRFSAMVKISALIVEQLLYFVTDAPFQHASRRLARTQTPGHFLFRSRAGVTIGHAVVHGLSGRATVGCFEMDQHLVHFFVKFDLCQLSLCVEGQSRVFFHSEFTKFVNTRENSWTCCSADLVKRAVHHQPAWGVDSSRLKRLTLPARSRTRSWHRIDVAVWSEKTLYNSDRRTDCINLAVVNNVRRCRPLVIVGGIVLVKLGALCLDIILRVAKLPRPFFRVTGKGPVIGQMMPYHAINGRNDSHICLAPRPPQISCVDFDHFQQVQLKHAMADHHRTFENWRRFKHDQRHGAPRLVLDDLH